MKDDFKSQPWLPEKVRTFTHASSHEGFKFKDKPVKEECQTGLSPCYCPICTRLQQQSLATWREAEEILRAVNSGNISVGNATSYFTSRGFVLFRNPANSSMDQYSIGSNVLAGELSPGARPEPSPPEPEKSEAEKRWAAIADEMNK